MNSESRKFGFNLGLGLNILGCTLFYRHKEQFIWFSVIGSIALVSAVACPKILGPVKKILDKLIFAAGWFVSTISLLAVFYMIFAPISILLRIFGKDPLDEKIDRKASSYWIKRKPGIFSEKSHESMG